MSWDKSDQVLEKAEEIMHVLMHELGIVLDHNNQDLADAHHRL
jgi:hypothetical protein